MEIVLYCRLADFCISGAETSSSATREVDNWSDWSEVDGCESGKWMDVD